MKKLISILMALLMSVMCAAACADAETAGEMSADMKTFIEYMRYRGYVQSDLSDDELAAMIAVPGISAETEHARFELNGVAYDGSTLRVMVRVTPKDGFVLMSDYVWEATDPIIYEDEPDTHETAAERAQRTGGKVVACGIYGTGLIEGVIMDGPGYIEKYFSDGSMLLIGSMVFSDIEQGERKYALTLRDTPEGGERNEQTMEVTLVPTAKLETVEWQGECALDFLNMNSMTLRRSPLGTTVLASGKISEDAAEEQLKALTMQCAVEMELAGAGEARYDGGGMGIKRGGEFVPEAQRGDSVVCHMNFGAGDSIASSVKMRLYDFIESETLAESEVSFKAE